MQNFRKSSYNTIFHSIHVVDAAHMT